MKFLVYLLVSVSAVAASAQTNKIKEKATSLGNGNELTYHINDQKQKEGSYFIKNNVSGNILMKGTYKDDQKVGSWYFYTPEGNLESSYNFQQNKLLYIDSAFLAKIEVNIKSTDKSASEKASIPILLYPSSLFLEQIAQNVDIPADHLAGASQLPIKIIANIDSDGRAKYSVIYSYGGSTREKNISIADKNFDLIWMPAKYNGSPIESTFAMKTLYSGSDNAGNHKRFTWSY